MEKFSIDEICTAVDGQVIKKGKAGSISGAEIDSRKVENGDLYIPIVGENNDGHDFIPSAVKNGAAAVLTDRNHHPSETGDAWVIEVKSTFDAMKAAAAANRKKSGVDIVAVTGSAGKTTTKDLIASVLSVKFRTQKTQGNFNNEYGVPLTLFQLTGDDEKAVVEMGMNHMGEISRSVWEVLPHIGVITNIGSAHLENLGSRDNILKAKMEIFEKMDEGDIALVNGDNPYLRKIQNQKYQVRRIGIDNDDVDLKAEAVETGEKGVAFTADGHRYTFRFPGIHNVYNCLTAVWIGRYYGLTPEEIQRGLSEFVPSGSRMKAVEIGNALFYDDSYNANPESMKAAVNTLTDLTKNKAGRKIAVLGDMLEIGESAGQRHYEVGRYAGKNLDAVIAVGPLSKKTAEGAEAELSRNQVFHVDTPEEAAALLKKDLKDSDTVLLKASHSLGLSKIIEILKGE